MAPAPAEPFSRQGERRGVGTSPPPRAGFILDPRTVFHYTRLFSLQGETAARLLPSQVMRTIIIHRHLFS